MKKRIFVSTILTLLILILSKPESVILFTIGFIFVIFGEIIRLLAAATIKKNKDLAKEGFYSLCRNPLYLGSFIIILGVLIQITSFKSLYLTLSLWLSVLVVISYIYYNQIKTEEKFLLERFGDEYERYRNSVPCLIPKISTLKEVFNPESYSWKTFLKNKEYRGFLGILVVELILFLKLKYRV